jgi:S-formylglutathione hydrolase FrmB
VPVFVSLLVATATVAPVAAERPQGTVTEDIVQSSALEGNLFADSPRRTVLVYLPPAYAQHTERRYPVVYLLHGYKGSAKQWIGGEGEWNIRDVMDRLIASRKVREMIIVMPDVKNRLGGSFYTDSVATGNWEEFLSRELVAYVDGKYRTLSQPASRGIAGHSMGGYGAILLSMKHPEVFGAIYALSAATLGWGGEFSVDSPDWDTTMSFRTFAEFDGATDAQYLAQALVALAAAWSPNPAKPPFFGDYPVSGKGRQRKREDSAYARWSANLPVNMVDQYRCNLARLRGIAFDVGRRDQFTHIRLTNRAFAAALSRNHVPHTFEEYDGDHNDGVPERIETNALPFLSRVLTAEVMLAPAK